MSGNLNRQSSLSCSQLQTQYFRRKTDLHSIESLNYIRKPIIQNSEKSTIKSIKMSKDSNNKEQRRGSKKKSILPLYFQHDSCTKKLSEDPCCRRTCRNQCSGSASVKLSVLPLSKDDLRKSAEQEKVQKSEAISLTSKNTIRSNATSKVTIIENKDTEQNSKKLTPTSKVQGQRKTFRPSLYVQNYHIYNYGDKKSGFKSTVGPQDYTKLQNECLEQKKLFEDPEFAANDSSLFNSTKRLKKIVKWLRPREIVKNPKFVVEGYSRFDITQGDLGDCWFLSAIANLTLFPSFIDFIIPDNQDFDKSYAGIFHFRFWQYGVWVDVVVDDRLPTIDGTLCYVRSKQKNEFWSSLLEKAYAKLHSTYESLTSGSIVEAMEDFTGGVAEVFYLKPPQSNLFKILLKADERMSMMGCGIDADPVVREAVTSDGLVKGHAYSITKVVVVNTQSGKVSLLRLRNPWGTVEWTGPWSDKSREWKRLTDREKKELGLTFDDDGEFYINFKDFTSRFTEVDICNLSPLTLSDEEIKQNKKKKWDMTVFEGSWVKGVTAGGCVNYPNTFPCNPQFMIRLTEMDENDDDNKCTLIVALLQKFRRQSKANPDDILTIGFAIYFIPNPNDVPKPLNKGFFSRNVTASMSETFINSREVTLRTKLDPGTYCIIPSTFEPNQETSFILRVFTEKPNEMKEHDDEVGYKPVDPQVAQNLSSLRNFQELKTQIVAPNDEKIDEPTSREEIASFLEVSGIDNAIDFMELKQVLNNIFTDNSFKEFSHDTCRTLIALLDKDRSGKLELSEFQELLKQLHLWKATWSLYDVDESGTLNGFELRKALNSAGYRLNNKILNLLMYRYGTKQGELNFEDFVMCAVKLKTMIDIFSYKCEDDIATFNMEEWLEASLPN